MTHLDGDNPYRAPTEYGPTPQATFDEGYRQPVDSRAVISFVLGIVGFLPFCCCPLVGLPVGLVGVILGAMARHSPSRGLAIAGIILCGIQMLLSLGYVVFFAVMMISEGF